MFKFPLIVVAFFALASCQDAQKSEDVLLYEKNERELEVLGAELADLRETVANAKTMPVTIELEALQEKVAVQAAALAKLTAELAELEKGEKEAREALAAYREKYPLQE